MVHWRDQSIEPEPREPIATPRLDKSVRIATGAMVAFFGVGILVALLFPQIGHELSRRTGCANNLRQISLALHSYHQVWGSYPPAYTTDADGQPLHSWRTLILPFLEEEPFYEALDLNEPWNGPHNSQVAKIYLASTHYFCCPSSTFDHNHTNYLAVVGPQTAWPGATPISMQDISDSSGMTIQLVEVANSGIHWMEPRDMPWEQAAQGINPPNSKLSISSNHTVGANVAFCDSACRLLLNTLPNETLRGLLTIAGGEPIESQQLMP